MKRYEYVNLKMGKLFSSKTEEHRNIIDQYAARGYRFVGFVPTHIDTDGKINKIDLIFEIDV